MDFFVIVFETDFIELPIEGMGILLPIKLFIDFLFVDIFEIFSVLW